MKKIYLLFLTMVFVFSFGCSQRQEGKVIIDEYKNVSTNHSEMKNMDVYKEVQGATWLSDHQLIERHIDGIYMRDTNKKQTTLLLRNPNAYPVSSISPDKEHLLIAIEHDNTKNTYHIFNLKTKKMVHIPLNTNYIYSPSPKWIDNENLLAHDKNGHIFKIHISGKSTKLKKKLLHFQDIEESYQLQQAGDQFFYVQYYQLWVWNQRTKKTKKLMDRVNQFVLSPDKKQLAVVKVVPSLPSEAQQEDVLLGTYTLMLMDLNGKVKSTIAKGRDLSNIIWSMDSSQLAYILTDQEQPPKLYVANTRTSEAPKLLAVNLDGELIEWNPSGTQLCMNGFVNLKVPEEGSALYVFRLK